MNNTNNANLLIAMKQSEIKYYLSRQQTEEREEQLAFMKDVDTLWLAKNPASNFVLHTTNDAVKEAYNKMLNNHGANLH